MKSPILRGKSFARLLTTIALGAGCAAGQPSADSGPLLRGTGVEGGERPLEAPARDVPAPDNQEQLRGRATVPFQARWTHSSNLNPAQFPLTLELTLDRPAAFQAPVRVQAELPEGARLLGGELSAEYPAGSEPLVLSWTLDADKAPDQDFRVLIDVGGLDEGFGFHAEPTFSFGRPEPVAPELRRREEALELNGLPLGRPIDLNPVRGD